MKEFCGVNNMDTGTANIHNCNHYCT